MLESMEGWLQEKVDDNEYRFYRIKKNSIVLRALINKSRL